MKPDRTMSQLSTRGRVTIPREIRERLVLRAGDQVVWAILGSGTLVMRPKTPRRRIGLLKGSLELPEDLDAPLPDEVIRQFEDD